MVSGSESDETTSLLSPKESPLIARLNELTISTFSTATREQSRKGIKEVLSTYLENGAVVSDETADSVHSDPPEKPSPEKNLNEIIVILDNLKQRKEIELILIDVVTEKFQSSDAPTKVNEALSSLLSKVSSSEAVSKIMQTKEFAITTDEQLRGVLSNPAVQEAYGNNTTVKNAVTYMVPRIKSDLSILDNITGPEATTLGTLPSKIANPYRTMMGELYQATLKEPKPTTDQALIMYFMEKAKKSLTEELAKQINSAFPVVLKGANATEQDIDQRLADIIKNNLPISSKLPSGQLSPTFAEAILDYVSTKITDENRQSFLKITTNSAFKDYCKETIKNGFGAILKPQESETPSPEEILNKQIIPALKCYNPKEIGDIPLDPAPDLKTLLTTYGHLKIGSSDTAPSLTRLYADSVVSQQDKIQENLAALVDICIQQTTATLTFDDPKLTAKQTNSPPITTLLDKSKDGKCIADLVFAKGNLDTKTTLQNALTKEVTDLLKKTPREEQDEKHIKTICELAAAPANQFTDQNKQEIYKAFIEQKRYSDARTFLTSLPKLSIDKEFEYLREAQKVLQSKITDAIPPTSSKSFDEYIKERKEAQNSKIGYMKSLMSPTTDLKTMTDEYLSIEKRLNEIRLKAVDNKQLLANISEREYRDKLHEEMIKALESTFTDRAVSRTPDPKNPNKFEFCIAKTSSSGAGLASGAAQSSTLIAEVKPGLPRSIEFDFSKVAEADKKDATAAACEAIGNMKFQKIEIEGTIDSEEKLERVKALLQNLRKNYTADQLDLTNLKIAAPINSSKQEDLLVSAISNNQITNYLATLQEKAQPPKI